MSRRLLFKDATLVDPEWSRLEPGSLLVDGGRIAARLAPGEEGPPGAEIVGLGGALLAPGFIDLHYHGRFVFDPRHIDDAFSEAASMARHGVTAYLPTTVAWPAPELARRVEGLGRALDEAPPGAQPLGLHLEGPWINPAAAGAQPASGIRPADPAEASALLDAAAGTVRMVTLAPEVPGSGELMSFLCQRGVVVALGHSQASSDQAHDAVDRGARHVTHLYNAMAPLRHREPGLAGVALANERLTADLICDGAHVHPDVVRFTARTLAERLLLITDRIDPPSLEDSFGSGPVRDDGTALRLADGRLAGSRVTMDRALGNAIEFAQIPFLEAIAACTLRPAKLLGMEAQRGTLRPGARADFVALEADGRVKATWVAGERFGRD